MTTTRIAREAGTSVGSLYRYFPDRDAIVSALALRFLDAFEDLMDEVVAAASRERWDDPAAVLLDAFVARWRAEPGYRALWLGRHLTPPLLDADRENNRILADGIRRILVAQGHADDGEDTARRCLVAVLCADAVLHEAFRIDPDGDPRLLEDATVLLRSYLATFAPTSAPHPDDPSAPLPTRTTR
ncbi:MAG: TetR family transcriptional regulator [Solirubrobacteraceae bacterium]|nr:TetR family transcriptional regulator [Solirubrobacteraceae bacterium]